MPGLEESFMAIHTSTTPQLATQLATQLAADTQPASSITHNPDGTIDYYERIVLDPFAPSTLAATLEEPAGARVGSPASSLPPRKANLVLAMLQLLVGYAWLVSGVDKLLYGSFPDRIGQLISSALASDRLPDVFAQFLQQVVLPNAALFGVLIECGETLTGAGLLTGAALTLASPAIERHIITRQTSGAAQPRYASLFRLLIVLTMGAALGGAFLGLNFYVMDGMPIPWFSPGIAYGGAIHSGLLLALACLVILIGQIGARVRLPNSARRSA
jgi:uncharacterized membrane protein YphA (DoxX/SURF4 family)